MGLNVQVDTETVKRKIKRSISFTKYLISPKKCTKSEESLHGKIRRFSSITLNTCMDQEDSLLVDADRRMSVALEEIETFEREYLSSLNLETFQNL